uniref:Uncharacterized protein n=1 Tax=Caenorhabditis japonica TaxID=281687 RepID=A0A8R1DJX5_CAEJA
MCSRTRCVNNAPMFRNFSTVPQTRRVEEYIVKMRSTAHIDLRKRGCYRFETVWIFKNEALAEYDFCIK